MRHLFLPTLLPELDTRPAGTPLLSSTPARAQVAAEPEKDPSGCVWRKGPQSGARQPGDVPSRPCGAFAPTTSACIVGSARPSLETRFAWLGGQYRETKHGLPGAPCPSSAPGSTCESKATCPLSLRTRSGAGCTEVRTKCRLPAAGQALLPRAGRQGAAVQVFWGSSSRFLSNKHKSHPWAGSRDVQPGSGKALTRRFLPAGVFTSPWSGCDPAFCTHCLSRLALTSLQNEHRPALSRGACALPPMTGSPLRAPQKSNSSPRGAGGQSQHRPFGGSQPPVDTDCSRY